MDSEAQPRFADAGQPVAGNLPAQLTVLIGRDAALAELGDLLRDTRLLTLSGPGGCGKSRLAIELADAYASDLDGGVWWVDLGSVSDPALVEQVVVNTLHPSAPRGSVPEVVALHLGSRRTLLVLDNCEHLVDECAPLVAGLLAASPALQVLATSRRPLGVPGEQVRRVPGLTLPPPLADYGVQPAASTDDAPAVQLFVERARAASPSFELTAQNRSAVVQVCWQLDGLPLALELAAARVAVLSVPDIAGRLERDPSLLRQASRAAPARQWTLEATLDWSHGLLTEDERILLRRLAAFAGRFSLGAAEAVAGSDPLRPEGVLDLIAALVEQSVVHVVERSGATRYVLPTTVARYAAARLADSGEEAATRDVHARYFLGLADADARPGGPNQGAGPDRLAVEHDNLRQALRRLLPAHPEEGGRLAALLWPFWFRHGFYDEGRRWLEQAAADAAGMSSATQAEVLAGAGMLAFLQCEYRLARTRLEQALKLYQELGDDAGSATVFHRLGSIEREQARYDSARFLHDQARELWEQLGDDVGVAVSLDYMGFAAWLAGEVQAALELEQRALALLRPTGAAQETSECLKNLGAAMHYAGDDRQAVVHLEEALGSARALAYSECVAWSLHELGIVAGAQRDLARAATLLRESVTLHAQLGDRWRTCSVVEEIAATLLTGRDPERACELLAAADAERQAIGTPVPPVEAPAHARALKRLRGRLKPEVFDAAWERGRAVRSDQIFAEAVQAIDERYGGAAGPSPGAGELPSLTDRELAVLRLVCAGRTNREIGAELFISASTAGVHVSNILRKLRAGSRAEAAAIAVQLGVVADESAPAAG
ncbi:MAG: tetratricopeptide repeat protein [Thermoleophilaceae bacterium]